MADPEEIVQHYSSGELWERLRAALLDDGVDPERPSVESLAPYDQFHGRGLEATEEIAQGLEVAPADHLLDVGCGLGGPARYFARRFGCRVTGIDLTAEFCAVARRLTDLTRLESQVAIEHGSALDMPFAAASFDGAYAMNVTMNIDDKSKLYREIHRVVRPGGWFALSEIARGVNDGLEYPTPWSRTASGSFLITAEETRTLLEANGFRVVGLRDTSAAVLAYGERARAEVAQGRKPPHRAIALVHGDRGAAASANSARGTREGQIIPIEVRCVRLR